MPEKSSLWYLKQVNLLKSLTDDRLMQMQSMIRHSEVPKRQIIYFPKEPSQTIFFLKKGRVKISKVDEEGREVILDIVEPGEVFGELSLTGSEKREHMAVAMDDALICAVRKEDFEEILRQNPDLNLQLTRELSARLQEFQSKVEDLTFKDVTTRVVTFLIRYAERFGKHLPDATYVKPFLSHEEIAQLTASSRQTVTSILDDLRKKGLIDFKRNFLKVPDMSALKRIASK